MTSGKRKCLVCFRFVLTKESQEVVHRFFFFFRWGGSVFNKIIIQIANVGYDCGEVAVRRGPNVTGADGRKDGLKNQLLDILVRL